MTSIRTNIAAMTALNALNRAEGDLTRNMTRAATGLRVGAARDDAAIWAVSVDMRSDLADLRAAQGALALGRQEVTRQRLVAETVVDLLKSALPLATDLDATADHTGAQTKKNEIDAILGQVTDLLSKQGLDGQAMRLALDETGAELILRGETLTTDSLGLSTIQQSLDTLVPDPALASPAQVLGGNIQPVSGLPAGQQPAVIAEGPLANSVSVGTAPVGTIVNDVDMLVYGTK